jgi:hypothetical protein
MAAISMFVTSLGLLGAALIGLEMVLLLRWHAPTPEAALSSSLVCPPGWYEDPWRQVTFRGGMAPSGPDASVRDVRSPVPQSDR